MGVYFRGVYGFITTSKSIAGRAASSPAYSSLSCLEVLDWQATSLEELPPPGPPAAASLPPGGFAGSSGCSGGLESDARVALSYFF